MKNYQLKIKNYGTNERKEISSNGSFPRKI